MAFTLKLVYLAVIGRFLIIACQGEEDYQKDDPSNPQSLSTIPNNHCFKYKRYPHIPFWHISKKKTAPLILAHRGNIIEYQENTLEGITSLIGKGIDGVEFDVFLTKDHELVVFHDENTLRMTGKNGSIWDMTYSEIRKLNLKTTIRYSNEYIYNYSRPAKIPLLKDVLKALRKSNILLYIELKPYHNPIRDRADLYRAIKTGKAVAELVTEMGMEGKVFIMSFEPIKVWAAKRENPDLVTGIFYHVGDWQLSSSKYAQMKTYYKMVLPGLSKCLDTLPNNSSLIDFLFSSQTLLHSMRGSVIGLSANLFIDPRINQRKNLFKVLANSLVPTVSVGAGIVYYVLTPKAQQAALDRQWQGLIKQGIQRLMTDDPFRLKKRIGRVDGGYTYWTSYGACSKTCGYGIKIRTRNCTNPVPANGGMSCRRLGPSMQTRYCKVKSCPVPYYRRTWDGYTLRLRCNRGTKINILYAMYGRIQKSIYSLIYCKSCSAKLKMKGYCQAKATCLVKVSTKIFGNPCRGIHKYLKVKYTCICIFQNRAVVATLKYFGYKTVNDVSLPSKGMGKEEFGMELFSKEYVKIKDPNELISKDNLTDSDK